MILKYGSYSHATNECSVVITKETIKGDDGFIVGLRHRWTINGRLNADDAAGLTVALGQLEAAYSVNGKTLQLLTNDGTPTHHVLKNANTIDGVQVISISYPEGAGAEYSTFRTYEIVIEAETGGGTGDNLTSFSESITIIGTGGPRRVIREMRNGPPVEQIVSQQTPVRAVQSGSATSKGAQPSAPGPIWPGLELQEQRNIETSSSTNPVSYTTTWSYQFASASTL